MWEIWTNYLLPIALKSYTKSNKSPNLVTLITIQLKLFPSAVMKQLNLIAAAAAAARH